MELTKEELEHLKEMREFAEHFGKVLEKHIKLEKESSLESGDFGQWRCAIEDTPEDYQNVLVSWQDNEGWKGPIRACYCEDDNKYYPLDTFNNIPINCDIWCPIPKFPKFPGEEL